MSGTVFPNRLMVENVEALVTPLPGTAYLAKLREVVGSAKHSVDVMQYLWAFYPHEGILPIQQFNQGVLRQIRQGVKYRVLLNVEARGHKLTRLNMQTKELLLNAGAQCKFGPLSVISHSKIWIIDDDIVILGSHNLTKLSVSKNDECSVMITGRAVASEYRRYFDVLWSRS